MIPVRGRPRWPSAALLAVAVALVVLAPGAAQTKAPAPKAHAPNILSPEAPGAKAPTPKAAPSAKPAAEAEPKAKPKQTQEGLPPALCVSLADVKKQLERLGAQVLQAQQEAPRGGFLSSLKGLFGGSKQTPIVSQQVLMDNSVLYDGKPIAVEGYCEVRGGRIVFDNGSGVLEVRIRPKEISVNLPGGEYRNQPATVEGVTSRGGEGLVLIATKVKPAAVLAEVRMGRLEELQGNWKGAVEHYAKFVGKRGAPVASDWAPFALCRAASLYENELRGEEGSSKQAHNLYNAAWMAYANPTAPGVPRAVTWVLTGTGADAAWSRHTVREAISAPLDAINRTGVWYRVVDTFVKICGEQAWLALIMISVVTRLLLYPLSKKQLQSAKEMRKLSPQVKALQEKYKDDKQAQQQAIMKLYKEHGVNIFGGCLPLVVQLPFFWLVYGGIRAYIVPLSQHGFLWVHDLSAPDQPLLILYLASMVLFQWMTNKAQPAMDAQQEQQQRMMIWFMPLMMWFFLGRLNLSSGFILYWLGSNLIYIPTQYLGMREQRRAKNGAPVTLEPRPAAGSGGNAGGGLLGPLSAFVGRLFGGLPSNNPGGNPGSSPGTAEQPEADKPRRSFEQKRREEAARRRGPAKRKRKRRV